MQENGNVTYTEVAGSTNRDLETMLCLSEESKLKIPEYHIVITDYQENGRGQGSNQWHSEAGQNLLASICFYPPLPASRQFVFNEYFALSVRDLLSAHGVEAQVKWPNDIYIGDRKVAGILIEHAVIGERIRYTIAGIGLNLNETDFPEDLPNPISLTQITGEQYDAMSMAKELVACCQARAAQLTPEEWAALDDEYLAHLYRMEEWAEYEIHGKRREARITGVDAYGRLRLQGHEEIEQWCCGMKEVKYLINSGL